MRACTGRVSPLVGDDHAAMWREVMHASEARCSNWFELEEEIQVLLLEKLLHGRYVLQRFHLFQVKQKLRVICLP